MTFTKQSANHGQTITYQQLSLMICEGNPDKYIILMGMHSWKMLNKYASFACAKVIFNLN